MISPAVLSDVFRGDDGIDKIALFSVPVSVLSVVALNTAFHRPWIAQALLLPFYLLAGIDLYLLHTYEARLSSSTLSLMLENAHHLSDFAQTQMLPLLLATALPVGFCGLVLFKTSKLRNPTRRPVWLAVAGLVLIYGSLIAWRTRETGSLVDGVEEVVFHDRSSPFGVLPQGYLAWRVYVDAQAHQDRAARFSFGAMRTITPEEPEVYVLVIGESSRPDRWGLYGYPGPTTPRLSREPRLLLFRDMLTQAALTQESVPLMITRNRIEAPDERSGEKSILSAYKEAGFKTYWLSTQQRDQFTGAINRYSGEADQSRFFERRHDGILVDAMKKALEVSEPRSRLFFVLHTQGSHFVFRDRYPAARAPFTPTGSDHERMLAEYDNSIAYTDEVLSQVIGLLKARPGISALLYVADHGENLNDDDRELFGHFFNNEYDLPIPAFLWYSEAYAQAFPEKIEAAKANASRPLNTRVVFSTLADMGSLKLRDMDVSALSVMSRRLSPPPRLFSKNGRITDYDEWRARVPTPARGVAP
ncbi:MAG: phosphoethanolamine transferase [Myxococcaceae bacterium]